MSCREICLYDLPIYLDEIRQKAESQRISVDLALEEHPETKEWVPRLGAYHDARMAKIEGQIQELSSEIEHFLEDISKRFGRN